MFPYFLNCVFMFVCLLLLWFVLFCFELFRLLLCLFIVLDVLLFVFGLFVGVLCL